MTISASSSPKRLAALWFADIVGYTSLSASDGGEALRLVRLLQGSTRFRARQYGGRVVKFIGDAAFAEFTSATDAASAAVALQADFAAGAEGRLLRIGIHLGEVTPSSDGDLYGDGVNLAARLQSAAEPGQIVVSEDVWRQLRAQPVYRCTELGTRELKGIREAVALFAVSVVEEALPPPLPLGAPALEPATDLPADDAASGTPFFRREAELERLNEWLAEALAGRGRVGFAVGDAGRGKSALLAEFARRALESHPDLLVATGTCDVHLGLGDPYGLFADVLRQFLGDHGVAGSGVLGGAANAQRIAAFLPTAAGILLDRGPDLIGTLLSVQALIQRFGLGGGADSAWLDRMESAVQQRATTGMAAPSGLAQVQLFEQCTNVLRAMAAERPLIIILDDLHWADDASVALLFHLSRRLADCPLLLLGTYRGSDVAIGRAGNRHPLEAVLHEIQRVAGEVTLDLDLADAGDSRGLMEALVDAEPNDLGLDFRDALFTHTEGHALFTVELLRNLRERGDLTLRPDGVWVTGQSLRWDAVPAKVEGVIGERIDRLDAELRDVLSAGSVEGDEFTAEVVAQVRGGDARALVRRLSGELDRQHRLVAAHGLLRAGRQRLSLYRFGHNAIRRYLYGRLDLAERSYLHEDVAHALEELYADEVEEVVAQLAHHYTEAGDTEKATAYLVRAGESAMRRYANAEARLHFERALGMLAGERAPWAGERAATARESLGDVLALSAEHALARTHFQERLSNTAESAPTARARLLRKIASTHVTQHQSDDALVTLAEAEALLGSLPEHDQESHREWVQVQIERLQALYYAGRVAELAALAEAVSARVQTRGTPHQRAAFLRDLCLVRFRRERFVPSPETVALCLEACRAAEEAGELVLIARAGFGHAFGQLLRGELEAADAGLREVQPMAERAGDRWTEVLCRTYLAMAARLAGEVERARERNAGAAALSAAADMPTYAGTASANAAWIAYRSGALEEAQAAAERAFHEWKRGAIAYPLEWLARFPLLAIAHRGEQDEEAVRQARGMLGPVQQLLPPEIAGLLEEAVEAWDAGDAPRSRRTIESILGPAAELGYL